MPVTRDAASASLAEAQGRTTLGNETPLEGSAVLLRASEGHLARKHSVGVVGSTPGGPVWEGL